MLYRALIDASPNAIMVSDLNFKIVLCNRQAAQLHGVEDPAKLIGHDIFERLSAGAAATAVKRARELLQSGTVDDTFECEIRRWDGSAFPAEISASFITDPEGKPLVFRCVLRDITERKEVENELQSSEQRYRQLFERNLVGLYRTDEEGRILDCNDALATLLGCESREELLGSRATDFYFDVADRQDVLRKLDERSGLTNQELRLRRKDGTPIWVLESATRIEWESGEDGAKRGHEDEGRMGSGSGRGIVLEGTLVDITQRKRAEEALRESEERFHLVTRATNDVIYDYDMVAGQVWWNEGLETQLGYDPAEAKVGLEWWLERLHPADRQRAHSSLLTAIENGEQYWSRNIGFGAPKQRTRENTRIFWIGAT